jgi:His/Glu/Gln/Arg/opine family amino acid ABC transporter permease subunit
MDFSVIFDNGYYFIEGTKITILLSVLGAFFGLILGTLLALAKNSKLKPLKWTASAYVELIRGTPMLVQLYIVYLAVQWMPMMAAGVIALSINSSAYVAEIVRAGIDSVDHGQEEAARSLGLSRRTAFSEIILPQAIKNIIPAIGNELVVLIKESSIISVIGVSDLVYNAKAVQGVTYKPFEPLIAITVIYFVLTFATSRGVQAIERRMKVSDR